MSFLVALPPSGLVIFPLIPETVPVTKFTAFTAPPTVSPFFIWSTASFACFTLSRAGLFTLAVTPI